MTDGSVERAIKRREILARFENVAGNETLPEELRDVIVRLLDIAFTLIDESHSGAAS